MSSSSPDAKDILKKLISFDTTIRYSNLACIGYIQDFLESLGASCRLTYDDAETKANIFASLGPLDRPGLILSGHTDVVPVDG